MLINSEFMSNENAGEMNKKVSKMDLDFKS